MTEQGFIQPNQELIKDMFFRKPGLPILNVRMPDGKEVPYWNTFYQEITYEKIDAQDLMRHMDIQYASAQRLADLINRSLSEGKKPAEIKLGQYIRFKENIIDLMESRRKYLGQMDLNIKSPLVWEFYEDTIRKLYEYGARIIRLDAFAYTSKVPGFKNFLNEPETWIILERIKMLASQYSLTLLPEIHSRYEEKTHEKLAEEGYITYDFFLPGLIIDALERNTREYLTKWISEIQEKKIRLVNMLGCHDGIPLLDLKGLVPDDQINVLIKTVVSRGGHVKDIHGGENTYYQVNATYFSALGEDPRKLILARAIQIFMPGKPQVWYLDLFAGKNDYEAVKKAGQGGHKEINRTNLTIEQIRQGLKKDIVLKQLSLLRFRNTFPAFGYDAELENLSSDSGSLKLCWQNNGFEAYLEADLKDYSFTIKASNREGNVLYQFESESPF